MVVSADTLSGMERRSRYLFSCEELLAVYAIAFFAAQVPVYLFLRHFQIERVLPRVILIRG